MIEIKAWKCECGKNYFTKKAAYLHEKVCKCWTNPKWRTCKTCKFGKLTTDTNGMEREPQFLHTWMQWECSNPIFNEDLHFTAAHEKAPDLNINYPVWENKKQLK